MDDFYKQIRDSLNGLPEPSFRNKDWNALYGLMRSKRLSPLAFWSWLAVPLLLTLAMVSFWQYGTMEFNQPDGVLYRTDTVYVTETVIIRDTVFLSEIKTLGLNNSEKSGMDSREIRRMKDEIAALRQQLKRDNRDPLTPAGRNGNVGIDGREQPVQGDQSEVDPASKNEYWDIATNTDSIGKIDIITDTNGMVIPVKIRGYAPLESPLLARLPSRMPAEAPGLRKPFLLWDKVKEELSEIGFNPMQIGVSAGLFYPSFGTGDFQIGKIAGLQAIMPVTEHIQAESNLVYQSGIYETEDLTETGGILPVSPAVNERFLKVEAPFKAFQLDLGLNYVFNSSNNLQPKLGLGYGIIYYYQNELGYEYQNTDNGITYSIEDGGNYNGLKANTWLIKTGTDYHLNNEWVLSLMGHYRIVGGTTDYITPSYWSYGLGIRYKF